MGLEDNLSPSRKGEVERNLSALFERYEASFNAKLSKGEVLELIEEIFTDNRKNFIKAKLGPITFADRDYIVKLFKTKAFYPDEELDNGKVQDKEHEGASTAEGLVAPDKGVGEEPVKAKRGRGAS